MSGGDDLDALFGAFDGEEQQDQQQSSSTLKDDHDEPDRKKARLENDHDRDQTTTEKNVEAESGRPSRPDDE